MYYRFYHSPIRARSPIARELGKHNTQPASSWIARKFDVIKKHYLHEDNDHYNTRLLKFYRHQHVIQELLEAGLTNIDIRKRECRSLIHYLHPYEHVKGAIRGHLPIGGAGLLVATNLRVIFIRQMPFFTNLDEVSYDVVSSVTCNQVGNLYASVTLRTRSGDYELNFVNRQTALKFADFIENMSLDRAVMKEQVTQQLESFHLTHA